MKNKKGFTLIELLAVIVILGIIMTIATTAVIKNINDSKTKAKYIAAKEITTIGSAYLSSNTSEDGCVSVITLINEGYLEKDTTNPRTGENGSFEEGDMICKSSYDAQTGYEINDNEYHFEGYKYVLASSNNTKEELIGDVNQDGKLTKEDVELILKFATNEKTPTETQKTLADVNGDGKINAVDARKVLQKLSTSIVGDVNQDGKLTEKDADLILKFASGEKTPTETQKSLADVNGDGNITAVDARKVLQMVNGDNTILENKGDVNQDGKLTEEDADLILKFASGEKTPTETQRSLADVNGDGNITAVDARKVLQKLSTSIVGDVNQDGKLTEEDADLILKFATSEKTPTETQKTLADINGDGNITAVDARIVLLLTI